MAAVLGVPSPPAFAKAWFASYEDRATGRLGNSEEAIRVVAMHLDVSPTHDQVVRASHIHEALERGLLEQCKMSLPVLDDLLELGLKLAIVSNCSEEVPRIWPGTVLASRIPVAVFSCKEQVCKPDPRIYLVATERLGVPPQMCAFVGDGGNQELSGAERLGMLALQFQYPDDPVDSAHRVDTEAWTGRRLLRLQELTAVLKSSCLH